MLRMNGGIHVKRRLISWTALVALCTWGLAACSSDGSDPFGSSGGSGSGAGGAAVTSTQVLMTNSTPSTWFGQPLSVLLPTYGVINTAGPTDTIGVGGPSVQLSTNCAGEGCGPATGYLVTMSYILTTCGAGWGSCPVPPTVVTANKAVTGFVEFDLEIDAPPAYVNNVVVSWGAPGAQWSDQIIGLSTPATSPVFGGFQHFKLPLSSFSAPSGTILTNLGAYAFQITLVGKNLAPNPQAFSIANISWTS